jgi:hypothetical protein
MISNEISVTDMRPININFLFFFIYILYGCIDKKFQLDVFSLFFRLVTSRTTRNQNGYF